MHQMHKQGADRRSRAHQDATGSQALDYQPTRLKRLDLTELLGPGLDVEQEQIPRGSLLLLRCWYGTRTHS
jgi:hypothetical protein